jgi:hypothetical protein
MRALSILSSVRAFSRFRRWLETGVLCCLAVVLMSGCVTSKGFWQKHMKLADNEKINMSSEWRKEGEKPPLVLTDAEITNAMTGTVTNGGTRVSYGTNLHSQAVFIAKSLEQAFTDTESTLKIPLPLRSHVYLLRLAGERRVIRASMSAPYGERHIPLVFVLTNSVPAECPGTNSPPEALWTDLHEFPLFLFLLTHECREFGLMFPELLVMPDISASKGLVHVNLKYHTRWFRDGFANYTAYKASQSFRRSLADSSVKTSSLTFCEDSLQPFSKLAKMREKVFDWNQNSKEGEDGDDYEAAMALFLLLEEQKGVAGITTMFNELPNVKSGSGRALVKMIREKTGVDLIKLAREVQFPDLGLETEPKEGGLEVQKLATDGWAARTGLMKGDIIVEANGRAISGRLEFEREVLKAFSAEQKLGLTVVRESQRLKVAALDLPGRPRST